MTATRRLAAILVADVVGYSRLMEANEAGTLAALKERRKTILEPVVKAHGGRIVKVMGDGVLVEFASAVNAVETALQLQDRFTTANEYVEESRRILLRIGINLGEVVGEGADIFGDGVNIAARLEAVAEPGGICISSKVYDEVRGKIKTLFADLGEQQFKNISAAIRVYGVGGARPMAAARPPVPPRGKPSIVVLPFDNLSSDPSQDYFADGMVEDIITALSHFHELFVVARNTSFAFKGRQMKVDAICRELGVHYALEGSVRKAGDRIRVTVQLIEGENGNHVWASRYDRNTEDLFAVQDEITQAIVTAVAPGTIGAELKRLQLRAPANLSTWEKVLQARWRIHRLNYADNAIAQQLLGEAIDAEPGMVEAHTALAVSHVHDFLHVWSPDSAKVIEAAHAAARQAVAFDGNDASALTVLGRTSLLARRFDDATDFLNRAIRHNPNLADAYGTLCALHGVAAEYEASCAALEQALSLSPLDAFKAFWYSGKGICCYITGRYEECIGVAKQSLRDYPGYASALRQLTAASAMLGRHDEARAALHRLVELMPGLTISRVRPIVPFKYPQHEDLWLEGLRKAGLPE